MLTFYLNLYLADPHNVGMVTSLGFRDGEDKSLVSTTLDWQSSLRACSRFCRAATVVGLVLGLAACDEGPSSNTRYMHPAGTWDFLVYATQNGPLLIDIEGQALPGNAVEFEGTVIALMNEAQNKRLVRFTPDPAVAPSPDFRVVVAFNGGAGLDSKALCSGQAKGGGPDNDRIETLATFCRGGEVLSAVHGWATPSDSVGEQRFQMLIQQVTRDLFATAPPDR